MNKKKVIIFFQYFSICFLLISVWFIYQHTLFTKKVKSPSYYKCWGTSRYLDIFFNENKLNTLLEKKIKNEHSTSININKVIQNDFFVSEICDEKIKSLLKKLNSCSANGNYYYNKNGFYCTKHGSVSLDPYGNIKEKEGAFLFNLDDSILRYDF